MGLEWRNILSRLLTRLPTIESAIMRAFITIFILASVVAWIYFNESKLGLSDHPNIVNGLSKIRQIFTGDENTAKKTTIYKTKDENGNWVFTNKPGENASPSQQHDYYSNTNIIPSLREQQLENIKKQKAEQQTNDTDRQDTDQQVDSSKLNRLMNLVDDSKAIEGKLEKRKEKQDQIINQQ